MQIKKISAVILAVIMVVLPLAVISFAGEEHIHTPDTKAVILDGNYHGYYCTDCGKLAEKEEHIIPEYIPDGNESFLFNSTETGTCSVCGQKVTRTVEGSALFLNIISAEKNPIISQILGFISQILNMIKSFGL